VIIHNKQTIFLVEDNDDDAELTSTAFRQAKVVNPIVRARDGVDALDYLFARGPVRQQRCEGGLRRLFSSISNFRKLSGFEVLNAIRTDERTKHFLSSSLLHPTKTEIDSSHTITTSTATWSSP